MDDHANSHRLQPWNIPTLQYGNPNSTATTWFDTLTRIQVKSGGYDKEAQCNAKLSFKSGTDSHQGNALTLAPCAHECQEYSE